MWVCIALILFFVILTATDKSENSKKCPKCGLPLILVTDSNFEKRCSRCGADHDE